MRKEHGGPWPRSRCRRLGAWVNVAALAAATLLVAVSARGSEIGHFNPGLPGIRDLVVPAPGVYGVIYTYAYASDRLHDRNGDEIDEVRIAGPSASVTLDVDVDLDAYVLAPAVMWAPDWKFLGGRYAAYGLLPVANTTLGAALTAQTGTGRSVEEDQVGVGDLFVQPIWLGWTKGHLEFAAGYGFYAPVGKYDTETVALPVVGPVTAESAENVGLGFWTHQLQGTTTWYPWMDKRMAVTASGTWEIHGQKQDFDLTPGQNLSLNWGVSEYLPLKKDGSLLLEIGPAGYSTWQITDDDGDDARYAEVRDEVHGVGVQVGATHVPWKAVLNFRYMYEYAATDRFRGQSLGLNCAVGF